MQEPEEDVQQHLYKVLVIGDYAVGKTSLIRRYIEGYFNPNYKLTIGVDFAVKVIEWDKNTRITLQVRPSPVPSLPLSSTSFLQTNTFIFFAVPSFSIIVIVIIPHPSCPFRLFLLLCMLTTFSVVVDADESCGTLLATNALER